MLGLERSVALLAKIPLLDADDVLGASDWFHAHGRRSVFFGRFVPGVRSLISLPAGAQRMPIIAFSVLTALGSAIWNAGLVGVGYALGTQRSTVGRYATTISNIVILLLLVTFLSVLLQRARRRRAEAPSL